MERLFIALLLVVPSLTAPASGQVSTPSPLPGDLAIAPLTGQKFEPYIAAGNGGHLAVWLDRRGALAPTVEGDPWEVVQSDVYALCLDAAGAPIGFPIRVDGSAYSQEAPRAAFNGTDWLVVYESRSISSTGYYTTQDVRATRLSSTGQVLDSVALAIDVDDTETYVPCVASDGTDWGVFWTTAFTTFGCKVFADGTLGPVKTLYDPASWHFDPEVAFAGDRYLLVWEGEIEGRFLDTNLDPLGAVFPIGGWTDAQVATDGTDFFVTYANLGTWSQILGTIVRSDGTVLSPGGQLLDGGTYLASEPAGVTWDGSGYVVAWTEYRNSFPTGPEESILVNRFDANGTPVWSGPTTVEISTDYSVRNPMISSLVDGRSLVGWMDTQYGTKNYYTGQGTIVDTLGNVIAPPTCTMVGPPAQLHPDLVRGPTGATVAQDVDLAVFLSCDAAETRVVFQRVDGAGNALDPEPVLVAGGTDRYTDPTAAWNGTEWLVVWEDETGGAFNGGALAARVLPDGTVLDTTPIQVVDGNDPDVGALTTVGGDFFVAATQETSGDIRTLYGQRIAADGTLVGGKTFIGSNYALAPSVEGFDDRWIVMWHRKPTHDDPFDFLQARFVFPGGTIGELLDPSNSTTDEVLADVAINGSSATFVWSDGTDIRLRQMQKDGAFLGDPAGVVVNSAVEEQTAPSVAFDGTNTIVTWVDDRIQTPFEPGLGDLYGARLDGSLTVLDPAGIAIAADPNSPEGESALSSRLGETSVLYPAMLPSFGQWRVSLATWFSSSEVFFYCTGKTSSAGCVTTIATSAPTNPVSGAGSHSIDAVGVQGLKNGLAFAGISGPAAIPFSGGTLCVQPPTKRGPVANSGGMSLQSCDGSFSTIVNDGQVIPFGLDAGPGNSAWYQYWYRDPANGSGSLGTALSNAVQLDFL